MTGTNSTQGILNPSDPEEDWRARGMPYAWTHRIVDDVTAGSQIDSNYNMSDDGYGDPDTGKFCYMGFFGGSAALNQTIETSGWSYHYWLEHFIAAALTVDISIHDALDNASQSFFYCDFDESPLGRPAGFSAIWPMYYANSGGWTYPSGNGRLVVYGNGNLKLYQPLLTVSAKTSSGSPLAVDVEIDGESVGTTSVSEKVFATFPGEIHNIEVTETNGYYLINITDGTNTYTSKNISIPIESDLNLTAYFTQEPPPPVAVTFVIDSTAVGDQYSRYHAFTVDNQIPTVFWSGDWYNQNPGAIIGIAATSLHYETTKYLTEGYHNIEYAVSSYVGYWSVTITANGQQVISQSTGVYNHATTQILVTDDPPPPPTYTLSISSTQGGYTDPSGSPQYQSGTYANVQAYANQGWSFAYWLLDGNNAGSNPSISVYMDTNHNLQAVFAEDVQYHTVNIFAYEDYYMGTVYAPFYIDGQYVGTTPYTTSLPEGNHVFSFESPIYDYPYTFICISQNPQTVYINQYTEVTAIYTFN